MSGSEEMLRVGVLVLVVLGIGLFFGGAFGLGIILLFAAFFASLPLLGDDESGDDPASTPSTTEQGSTASRPTTDEALATLRARYARGELSDEQFERKLERLLDTETVEDAEEHVGGQPWRSREAPEREG